VDIQFTVAAAAKFLFWRAKYTQRQVWYHSSHEVNSSLFFLSIISYWQSEQP